MKFDDKGLIPAIIQDAVTRNVLMLGYMNKASFEKTKDTGLVTFYSRSKKRLWTKGESSDNYLHLVDWKLDCDEDTLLIRVRPEGPTCHKGTDTCWEEVNEQSALDFLAQLESVIKNRFADRKEGSYTASLFEKGTAKIAQKVGEEAVELVIEAMGSDRELFLGEAADLIYHFLVLIRNKEVSLDDIVAVLEKRHK